MNKMRYIEKTFIDYCLVKDIEDFEIKKTDLSYMLKVSVEDIQKILNRLRENGVIDFTEKIGSKYFIFHFNKENAKQWKNF